MNEMAKQITTQEQEIRRMKEDNDSLYQLLYVAIKQADKPIVFRLGERKRSTDDFEIGYNLGGDMIIKIKR